MENLQEENQRLRGENKRLQEIITSTIGSVSCPYKMSRKERQVFEDQIRHLRFSVYTNNKIIKQQKKNLEYIEKKLRDAIAAFSVNKMSMEHLFNFISTNKIEDSISIESPPEAKEVVQAVAMPVSLIDKDIAVVKVIHMEETIQDADRPVKRVRKALPVAKVLHMELVHPIGILAPPLMPQIQMQQIQMPPIQNPQIQLPQIQLPPIQMPQIQMAAFALMDLKTGEQRKVTEG